jgi:hypothetical protein
LTLHALGTLCALRLTFHPLRTLGALRLSALLTFGALWALGAVALAIIVALRARRGGNRQGCDAGGEE